MNLTRYFFSRVDSTSWSVAPFPNAVHCRSALVLGFLGFFVNPVLMFIAFFVGSGAAQEASIRATTDAQDELLILQHV